MPNFFTAIRAILDSQQPALPDNPPYVGEVREILTDIAAGGPQDDDSSLKASDEVMRAVRDFTNAKDWETTRQVVEAQQEPLFRSEVEAFFEQNIAHARTAGEERTVELGL